MILLCITAHDGGEGPWPPCRKEFKGRVTSEREDLRQWSPTSLAPGMHFMEDNFSKVGLEGGQEVGVAELCGTIPNRFIQTGPRGLRTTELRHEV